MISMTSNMLPIQSPATIKPPPPSATTNNHHKNWWTPLFGWSSEPDYIDSADVITEKRTDRRSNKSVNFSDEKAKKLRMMTAETMSFHDKMYHSAIASRLASDFSDHHHR
ncbi:hypothetical protein Tco_1071152 [Tanacetum coccineum]|uniref:Uncharacterized protein n=1 Tax=Tanacetum coccineum TaxID=301880 RepID=A0ABQ5HNI2_9ASTR